MHIMTVDGWKPLQPRECVPAPKDKTLCEEAGIPLHSTAEIYIDAIRRFLLPVDHPEHINEHRMWGLLSRRGR
jgi:hypothetical protein